MATSTPQKSPLASDPASDGRKRSRIESYFDDGLDALFGVSFYDKEAKERTQKTAYDQVFLR